MEVDQVSQSHLIAFLLELPELIDHSLDDEDSLVGNTFPVLRLDMGAMDAKSVLQEVDFALELFSEHSTLIEGQL